MQDQVRAVLVGCGGISGAWLNALRDIPTVDVVGLVDVFSDAAQSRKDDYSLTKAVVGTDLCEVLESTSPDVVFNCTSPEAHKDVTLTALRHGCHVLGEKPLADSMDAAREVVGAASEARRTFAVIQNRRYDPEIRRLRRFLESGQIGSLTTVNSDFYIGAHFGGFRDRMRHVLLLDMAIHTFDAARLITGADPVSVQCHEWNPSGSWYDHDASAVAIFEMTGSITYTYRGSWCAEGLMTSWEGDWRVIATNGTVTWDGAQDFKAQKVSQTGGFLSEFSDVSMPPYDPRDRVGEHAGVIREFVESVTTGATPETDCRDNIKSLAMVFGAIESAELDRRVEVRW